LNLKIHVSTRYTVALAGSPVFNFK